MKIDQIQLQNFHGFEALDLRLDPSLTLLIGENGAGKTAVLEGLAVALGGLFPALPGVTGRSIDRDDVRVAVYEHAGLLDRQPQWPVRVEAYGTIDGKAVKWTRTRASAEGRTTRYETQALKGVLAQLVRAVKAGKPRSLPVMAYYGTQRLWRHKKITEAKRGVGSRYDGYVDALDPASNHRLLAEWMYQQTLVELQRGTQIPQLHTVERAVCQCVEGATRFFFDVKEQDLMLCASGEWLPFSSLSDGYRNMVAMVADIAWRCAVLNPHLGALAADRSEGVVLIDEIDLHLHPRWQRSVLGDLRRAFPGLQVVTTTHSPQVIASARRGEVRVLARNALVDAQPFVEGRDTNSLLEDVLGVAERPEGVQARIDEMSRLLDDERYEQAKEQLDGLAEKLGPDDPAVIRARWILDREAAAGEGG
jgi:predicted ATP-binding protein involved in virulence